MTTPDGGVKSTGQIRLVPTKEQRQDALQRATAKIASYDWYAVDMPRLDKSLRALGVYGFNQIREALLSALKEIRPEDYCGSFPPEASYEEQTKDAPLFAFAWKSGAFGRPMYLKFCFHDDELYIVTFHQQRERA